jgi:uncharacterized membrane protein
MQTKTLGVIFVIIGLVLLVSGAVVFTYSNTQTRTRTLPVSEGLSVPLDLSAGDKVQGTITILDGGEGITVDVTNPNNEIIYNGGTVYNNVEFSFNAKTSGTYTVAIDNLSTSNSQTIEYSLTYPAIPSIVGIVIIIVGIFFVVTGVTMMVMLQKAGTLKQKA